MTTTEVSLEPGSLEISAPKSLNHFPTEGVSAESQVNSLETEDLPEASTSEAHPEAEVVPEATPKAAPESEPEQELETRTEPAETPEVSKVEQPMIRQRLISRLRNFGRVPVAKAFIPLYNYPVNDSTWLPLYQAITENPSIEFVIVVNPNSGPGDGPLPSEDYLREIPRLNNFRNVQTIGYIRVDWCRRPLSEAFAEIDTYASWASSGHAGLHVEGIFVDETPNHFSQERAEFLHAVRKYIRAVPGFSGRRLVVENPGTPPHQELSWYAESRPDVIFTCEEPFERFVGEEVKQRQSEYPYPRSQTGYQISGVPSDQVRSFTRDLRRRAEYLFVTDLVDDFYESFSSTFFDFIAGLDRD